jgi:hypothetical protein
MAMIEKPDVEGLLAEFPGLAHEVLKQKREKGELHTMEISGVEMLMQPRKGSSIDKTGFLLQRKTHSRDGWEHQAISRELDVNCDT